MGCLGGRFELYCSKEILFQSMKRVMMILSSYATNIGFSTGLTTKQHTQLQAACDPAPHLKVVEPTDCLANFGW